MSRETDIAWCAGFFDGEGHVSYRRGYPNPSTRTVSPQLMCSVSQNSENREVLDFFQSVVRMGDIKGPYPTAKGKTRHVIVFKTKEIPPLFAMLRPYLRIDKSSDFTRAFLQFDLHNARPTAEDFARDIRRKRKKGCPRCGGKWNGVTCFECGYM